MVPLSWLTLQALRHRLGPARQPAVRLWATYWHFLEVVWLILLAVFLITT
jgi:heme/copper-type cytochrome/quinol oxidase subunit 3